MSLLRIKHNKNEEEFDPFEDYNRPDEWENDTRLDDLDWIYFNGNGQPDSSEIATPENNISSVVEKQSSYQEIVFSAANIPEFSSFAIKIVMKGNDPAYVPKIQDIRAVAAF